MNSIDDTPRTNTQTNIDTLAINTIRFLAVDGVEKANSGHPGMPRGMAAPAYTLWSRFLNHNPAIQARGRYLLEFQ